MSYWFAPSLKEAPYLISLRERVSESLIICTVCQYLGVNEANLKTPNRRPEWVYARDLCVYFLRKYAKLNYPEISEIFHRHHSTAMYANDKVIGMLESKRDNVYQGDVDKICKLLYRKLN